MLEIGVQSRGIIRENAIEKGYEKIKNSGITCVDYDIVSPEYGGKLEVSYFVKHRECAERYGIRFSQVHAPVFRYEPENQDKLVYALEVMKKSIGICSLLGSQYLVIHPLEAAFEVGREEEKKINLAYFSSMAEEARRSNVMICIENMPCRRNERVWEGACSSAGQMLEYIEELNRRAGEERFGTCFDVGHANVLGKNLREEVIALGSHLKVLHIHDNDGVTDSHQLPYSFSDVKSNQSTTDWSGFLMGLRNIGFRGVLSFETYRSFTSVPGTLQEALLRFLYMIGVGFSHTICFDEKLEQMGTKKKILFGVGRMFDIYMKEYGIKFGPAFAVDNNASLWGTKKSGILICPPQDIVKVPEENRSVILCTIYYEEIEKQLNDMGIYNYELY